MVVRRGATVAVRPHVLHVAAGLFLVCATVFWWFAAVDGYLRMERPLAVAASAAGIGLMLPLVAVATAWYLLGWG